MENLTEIGFSVSHQFEGGRRKETIKKTTLKGWLGDSVGSNVVNLYGGDGGYEDLVFGGVTYSNAKVISQDSSYEGDQHFQTIVIEQKIEPDDEECIVIGELTSRQIKNYSDVTRTSRKDSSRTTTRTISLQLADPKDLESVPSSVVGEELLDLAISEINKVLDEDSGSDCESSGGNIRLTRSESTDLMQCSASVTQTKEERDICPEEGSNCNISRTESVSKDPKGKVTVSISGQISSDKEEFNCDDNGNRLSVSKSKYEHAKECYDSIDLAVELQGIYDSQPDNNVSNPCPEDFSLDSKSETHCEVAGTISFSASGSEKNSVDSGSGGEGEDPEDVLPDGVDLEETESTNGCINRLDRKYSMKIGEKKARDALSSLNFSRPEGFFGPFNLSFTNSKKSASVSMWFSDDPKYDVNTSTVFRSIDENKTVCPEQKTKKRFDIPCGKNIYQEKVKSPGYTKVCRDVEAFRCATNSEIISEILNDTPQGSVILEDTFNLNINDGSKTASGCIKYHTPDDLKECEDV